MVHKVWVINLRTIKCHTYTMLRSTSSHLLIMPFTLYKSPHDPSSSYYASSTMSFCSCVHKIVHKFLSVLFFNHVHICCLTQLFYPQYQFLRFEVLKKDIATSVNVSAKYDTSKNSTYHILHAKSLNYYASSTC